MRRYIYYLVSFIAGGVLMASELLVAKLIGPYFGASLYVWAATIGTTLMGLAGGYYYSGILSEKEHLHKKLLLLTGITATYLLILPVFSGAVMNAFISMDVVSGILISTVVFNMPLFFLFGIFSPLIIQLISKDVENAGAVAGRVYGISTLSGVLFMVIVGVYSLPAFGTSVSVYALGTVMLVCLLIVLGLKNKTLA